MVVVGGGPGSYIAAIKAAQLGLKVIVLSHTRVETQIILYIFFRLLALNLVEVWVVPPRLC